jgi:hypothetical protein
MKRTMNRLLIRFALLCVAIILGAIAVAQAQRGLEPKDSLAKGPVAADENTEEVLPTASTNEPIPFVQASATGVESVENQPEPQPPITWAALPAEAASDPSGYEPPIESTYVESAYVDQSVTRAGNTTHSSTRTCKPLGLIRPIWRRHNLPH